MLVHRELSYLFLLHLTWWNISSFSEFLKNSLELSYSVNVIIYHELELILLWLNFFKLWIVLISPGRIKRVRALSQVRICKLSPLPAPQFCSHFHERRAQCWIEWKINFQIFVIFISWFLTDFISKLTKYLPTKKNVVQKCSNLQEKCRLLWKLFF